MVKTNLKRNTCGKLKHEKLISSDLFKEPSLDFVPNSYLIKITKNIIEGDNDESEYNFDTEMSSLLKRFKVEVNEILLSKKSSMEEFVKNLMKLKENEEENERKAYFLQLQEFKRLNEEFCKGMKNLDLNHSKQYASVVDEMRNNMSQLQKKMLMETQQKEMGNIRKHLKLSLI
ncbi:uncharacterized protein NPIL_247801 [Nephila pilipes]|uniref:Uncharacterized protein n=1 Tax=Nephila pilipes TaxID=299642 RepID=A0A8X6K071_NEPPI|nr:uncharacterized protein NPIL_247801 [Nephila pilipes]